MLPLLVVMLTACGNQPDTERATYPQGQVTPYMIVRNRTGGSSSSKIKLSNPELNSLKSAVGAGDRGPAGSRIEVDAENGNLVFRSRDSSGSATSQQAGNESEVALTEGGPARKLVATPAAQQLMEKKLAH